MPEGGGTGVLHRKNTQNRSKQRVTPMAMKKKSKSFENKKLLEKKYRAGVQATNNLKLVCSWKFGYFSLGPNPPQTAVLDPLESTNNSTAVHKEKTPSAHPDVNLPGA